MRSLSSSEVICNISMRWRNWGVSTSRWERLVVSLRDIPQIGLPKLTSSFRIVAGLAAREDYNRLACAVADSMPQKVTKNTKVTCEIFLRGRVVALRRLRSDRVAGPNGRSCPPPLYKRDR